MVFPKAGCLRQVGLYGQMTSICLSGTLCKFESNSNYFKDWCLKHIDDRAAVTLP